MMDYHPIQVREEICLVASCYRTKRSSVLMGHLTRMLMMYSQTLDFPSNISATS